MDFYRWDIEIEWPDGVVEKCIMEGRAAKSLAHATRNARAWAKRDKTKYGIGAGCEYRVSVRGAK